ncbi:GspMb/PilO family protein [Pseudoduganella sp. OTU4001]|uniref:GspMb/PilO family protein n=1 Tax=Pseudoduganella sp. OTU4001 TaxID=3043854 RepID=UPI00313BD413
MSLIFSRINFHLRALWRQHRAAVMALAIAASAAVATAVAWAGAALENQRQEAVVASLRAARVRTISAPIPSQSVASRQSAPDLPKFSSQDFTAQFHETAIGVGLPVDEVAYTLEQGERQPYMRYRVTLTVKGRYIEVRKFVAALAAEMPHVTLDSVHCARESTPPQQLSCDLGFSAFFHKA